ncbi:hypothetical protein V6N13_142519 [Hibiscus sabdariffa]|uniref:Uncharacterized protein n=1 Tax=Hibiscus sabdariffa TaxID=183260 RepID=A0ABR2FEL6_9ROSI
MAPTSPGVIQALSTDFLLSLNSRAWLSRLSVAVIFADDLPVMRVGNPMVQEAISEQGALPDACFSTFPLVRHHHGCYCVIGRLLFTAFC